MKTKTILFCRVSSKEQEESGYSLPAQEKLLREYAEKAQLEVAKIFAIAESASGKKQREIFREMLKYVETNNIKVIICEKVDRLTRNIKDSVDVNDWINKSDNDIRRQVHFVKENVVLDKDSKSNEKFIWNIKVAVAQYYIDNLSEEVKKGQKEKLAQGWLPTRPPLGYKSVGEKGRKIHVIDEIVAPLVKKMFESYATGNYSLQKLTELVYQDGLRTVSGRKIVKSRIHQYLTDPFYIGMNRWNGVETPGNQATFIGDSLFAKVQLVLKSKTTPRYRRHNHLFMSLVRCKECNGLITWELHKGIVYGYCNHYRNCQQKLSAKEHEIKEEIVKGFMGLEVRSKRLAEWIKKALKESHKDEISYHSSSVGELNKQHDLLKQRLDKLYDDKLDNKITESFYQKKFKQYTEELRVIDKLLSQHTNNTVKYFELGMNFYELSQKATVIFKKASPDQKRQLIRLVFDKLLLIDGKLEYIYTKPFMLLHEAVKATNNSKLSENALQQLETFELKEKADIAIQTGDLEAHRSILLCS